jgi:hypothetical protein
VSRLERIALLAVLGLLLAGLIGVAPVAGGAGAVGGAAAGVLASGRLRRLSSRMDDRLGTAPARTGFRPRALVVRVVVQLGLLGALLLGLGLLPFVGDELFAATGAVVTAFPAVLTARGLR